MGIWRESMNERRPDYILAIRAQALDRVQELIEPYENDDVPPPDAWRSIVDAAFPSPPMAVAFDTAGESIYTAQRALDEYAAARRSTPVDGDAR